MKLPRRTFLHLAAGAAALPSVSRRARAQDYPSRPVRIVASAPPGGNFDLLARLFGQWLSERLGQPFIIDNRPGGGTNIGTEVVVRAPADGYTLLVVGPPAAINATLYDKLNFNFIRDIAPIAAIVRVPQVLVVHSSVPAKTVPEFIAYTKANPGKVNVASAGTGTTPHMAGELFKTLAGVNLVHVPYRGEGPAITDLLGGRCKSCLPVDRIGRANPGGQTTPACSDNRETLGRAARHSDHRRVRARLRGERLIRGRRAKEHARRNYRRTQQAD
jgi:tripartite-type tricarboxylate transporter receptor subunit TctC